MDSSGRPGPPGPYATPAELPSPVTDPAFGGLRFGGIEYARVMGFRPLRMDLLLPRSAPHPVPVVLWIHGGAWLFGSRLDGPSTDVVCRALLSRGVAVALVEYRLSGEALFPACLHDAKAAVRWLRRFGPDVGVDGAAIGAWGESSGGYLAAFLALGPTDEGLEGSVGVTDVSSAVAGDVVVVTIPFRALQEVPVDQLRGKAVIDTMNYYPQRDGHVPSLDDDATTSSELLQQHLPESHVVKAFNNITFRHLADLARPSGSPDRSALAIAGDDDAAKAQVTSLLDAIGYDTVDLGALSEGWCIQPGTEAYGRMYASDPNDLASPGHTADRDSVARAAAASARHGGSGA